MSRSSRRTFDLSSRKRALLKALLQEKGVETPSQRTIPRIEKTGLVPLSFAQQRLWVLDQFELGRPSYNITAAVRLKGSLDVYIMERSLQEIVRRHETLRTAFIRVEGEPLQVVQDDVNLPLPLVDLRGVAKEKREAQAQEVAKKEARYLFDLSKAPLLRVTLLQLKEAEYMLIIIMHHIISDGWSMGVFTREMATLYEAFSAGKPSPLPELPIQYVDFSVWQREWLQGDVLEAQTRYWKQQMGGELTALTLPTDHPRPAVWTYQGAFESVMLPKKLTTDLKTLSNQAGCTLFMTLLAAFKVLLHRYTRQNDIIVGSPIANRTRPEIEGLIGFFVNTLALRSDLSGNPSFREVLRRVKKVALEAYAHQDLPFEKLVMELQPERNLNHTPLFQVMFALQENPTSELGSSEILISPVDIHNDTAKFDLLLEMVQVDGRLKASMEYSTDLFAAATITRMLQQFQTLLQGMAADPDRRISDMPLLTKAERRQMVVTWNDTRTVYPSDRCVHQLFEAQAEQTPHAIAVTCAGEEVDYQTLNGRANQLAHYLRALGVGPDVLVGICLERSIEMIVGILSILKAGGAYVPLDPSYPSERLDFMVNDTQAPVLLTQKGLLRKPLDPKAKKIYLDADWEAIAQQSEISPVNQTTADNLAYVMYTSGSTGMPKGIGIPHRAINRLVNNTNYIQLGPADIIAQASNSAFDAATFEIWGALLHGAKLVIISRDVILSPQQFAAQLRAQSISTLFLTTALFNQLASDVPSAFQSVQHLLFGGQLVDPKWVRQVLYGDSSDRLLHVYGPTESTTFASWYLVKDVPPDAMTVPIGVPLSNTQFYVLDSNLQPSPIGVPGELYIGGDGLARGYLNHPELTARTFVPNPFSDRAGARMYKTGDLVRYLPNGNLEFIGRYDFQVKIRGFRVELGEIEVLLSQHPGVREVVVVAREDAPGGKRLVAYLIPHKERSPTIDQLRTFLKEKLPDYMIPTAFVFMDVLPLTPSKKVDRRALPAPDWIKCESDEAFVAPRDPIEEALAVIWTQVLGIDRVGIRDNFFELGGHSLLAVRLMSRIRERFERDLPLSTLFQKPTIEHLAHLLSQRNEFLSESPLVAIQPEGSKHPFFCVHPGSGQVFPYRNLAQRLDSEQPLYGLEDPGLDRGEDGFDRLGDMAIHYVQAIQTVQSQGPYFLGGWSFGGIVAFEMAHLLKRRGHEVGLLVLIDSGAPSLVNRYFASADDSNLLAVIANEFSSKADNLTELTDHLQQLDPDEQLEYVLEQVDRSEYQIMNIGAPWVHRQLQIFKARLQLALDYVPQVYPGKIVLFQAEGRRSEPRLIFGIDTIWSKARKFYLKVTKLGWRKLAAEPIETYFIPGDHATIFIEPNVQALADKLQACLDEATSGF